MKEYTVAIIFNQSIDKVLLILKNRPEWQEGKYNFPGGHIEKNEAEDKCISREILEECGISELSFYKIGEIRNFDAYCVYVFTAIYKGDYNSVQAIEDEPVDWFDINHLPNNIIPNLRWLIPFAKEYWTIHPWKEFLIRGTFDYGYGTLVRR